MFTCGVLLVMMLLPPAPIHPLLNTMCAYIAIYQLHVVQYQHIACCRQVFLLFAKCTAHAFRLPSFLANLSAAASASGCRDHAIRRFRLCLTTIVFQISDRSLASPSCPHVYVAVFLLLAKREFPIVFQTMITNHFARRFMSLDALFPLSGKCLAHMSQFGHDLAKPLVRAGSRRWTPCSLCLA